MERFVIIVKGWKPLTIITKRSILDVTAALDLPLITILITLFIIYMMLAKTKTFPLYLMEINLSQILETNPANI